MYTESNYNHIKELLERCSDEDLCDLFLPIMPAIQQKLMDFGIHLEIPEDPDYLKAIEAKHKKKIQDPYEFYYPPDFRY